MATIRAGSRTTLVLIALKYLLLICSSSPYYCATINYSTGDEISLDSALRFLNFPESYAFEMTFLPLPPVILLRGWYYKSGSDWLRVEVQNPDGSPGEVQISRKKSPDLIEHFGDPLASHQRFLITTRCSPECDLSFISANGNKITRTLSSFRRAMPTEQYCIGRW